MGPAAGEVRADAGNDGTVQTTMCAPAVRGSPCGG